MKKIILISLIFIVGCKESHQKQKSSEQSRFSVEILEEEALQFLSPTSKIEEIGKGYAWTEGPLWIEDGNYLLFSDIPNNKVFKINDKGDASVYLDSSGYTKGMQRGGELGSNGLLLNPKGELVLLQHGDRRIAKMEAPLNDPRSIYSTIIGDFEGKRFNSPNDATYDEKGNLFFTDPPYGLSDGMKDTAKELGFQGVYCLKTTGELMLLDTLTRPNGIAISHDGSKIYVAVSDPKQAVWYEYDLASDGQLANKRVFYDATDLVGKEGQQGLPDGMKMHTKGYLFATGPGGLWIFNKKGKAIARIFTGEATSNCAFDTAEKNLFLTADDYVLKVQLE